MSANLRGGPGKKASTESMDISMDQLPKGSGAYKVDTNVAEIVGTSSSGAVRRRVTQKTFFSSVLSNSTHQESTAEKDITKRVYDQYETIDFEEPDHEVLRLHNKHQTRLSLLCSDFTQYVVSFVLAVVIALLFLGLSKGTEIVGEKRIDTFREYIDKNELDKAIYFSLGTSLLGALIPAFLVVRYANSAIGSGMTEVIAFLNGAATLSGERFVTLLIKYVGIFGMVVAGLFSGIDGPMAKIGSGVAILMIQSIRHWPWFRSVFYAETVSDERSEEAAESAAEDGVDEGERFNRKITARTLRSSLLVFLEQRRLRLFATLGAAISIAAIFRAPVGGVMFAIEETTSFFEPVILIRTIFCTVIAYLVVGFINARIENSSFSLQTIEATLFPIDSNCSLRLRLKDILTYIIIGILAAFMGHATNLLLSWVQRQRLHHVIDPNRYRAGEVAQENEAREKERKERLAAGDGSTPQAASPTPSATLTTKTFVPASATWVGAIRLAEVAFVCVLTTAVVVLLPITPGLDVCTDIKYPYAFVGDVNPACQFLMSPSVLPACEDVMKCQEAFDDEAVCVTMGLNEVLVEQIQTVSVSLGCDSVRANQTDGAVERWSDGRKAAKGRPSKVMGQYHLNVEDMNLVTNEEGTCYYELRSLFWQTPERQLKLLLSRGLFYLWEVRSLAIFGLIYFVPNLIIGAVVGRILSYVVNRVYPAGDAIDPGAFGMIFMAAFWSGTSRLVLTVVVIVLELTGDFSYLPALSIVTFVAAWVSSGLGESLYHVEMENNGAPYLPTNPPQELEFQVISKIMTSSPICLNVVETLNSLRHILKKYHFDGFPVADFSLDEKAGRVRQVPIGYVRRARLLELINAHLLETDLPATHPIQLQPICTSSPQLMREDATAGKVFRMFRLLGLKHVFIIDREGFLVGMVTRRDLLRGELEKAESGEERSTLADLAKEFVAKIDGSSRRRGIEGEGGIDGDDKDDSDDELVGGEKE
ncbi:hypothetical protein HK101_011938 [Irineochytrium annulatum]|nr:hypothetical protein HK101_011938 [Irineochytrium annulatum]